MKRRTIFAVSLLLSTVLNAQVSRLGEDISYKAELSGQFGDGDYTPFWQMSNRYGLASRDNNSGYVRASIIRNADADSQRHWRLGYGADVVVPVGYTSHFLVQQLYADFQWCLLRLSVGQKERPLEMKNPLLSTGDMGLGINARPLPQVRLELADFLTFKRTQQWIGLKGHLAYGWYTDNRWQRDFNAGNADLSYTANSLYHSKAGWLRLGDKDKFPLVLTGGIEMICQFGGSIWNHTGLANGDRYDFGAGPKEYFEAFIPSGSDALDKDNPNIMGNQLGVWQARLDCHVKGCVASFYAEHYFEDHSQMGWDFEWKDMVYGAELQLPKNPFVSTLLYEHMRTTDQSGPLFFDHSDASDIRTIGGQDNYYNHVIYGAYQHAGFAMGNPLILSPIYNNDGRIFSYDNRVLANHFGISGNPCEDLSYRVLFTHEKSYGMYDVPHDNPRYGNFLLLEASYKPHQIPGLAFTASYGQNGGKLLGHSKGGMLTVSYSGWINKTK